MKKGLKLGLWIGGGFLAVLGTTLAVLGNTAFKDLLDTFASTTNVELGEGQAEQLAASAAEMSQHIEEEGIVLVRNKNNALPLSSQDKYVSVLGWGAQDWVYGGSGSGRVATPAATNPRKTYDLYKALDEAKINYDPNLKAFYADWLSARPFWNDNQGALHTYSSELSVLYEPKIADYEDILYDSCFDYGDAALIVIGRVTGESNDCPKVQYKSTTKGGKNITTDATRTYLDISAEEEELLEYAKENYSKTIVLINSTNAMNLSFLEKYDVDAALVVGCTGDYGALAIPDILYGVKNPSGRLTDTYVYDFASSPAFALSGPYDTNQTGVTQGRYTNSSGVYPADGTNYGNVSGSATYPLCSFVDYGEDIYVGYKFYETADAEGYFSNIHNDYGDGYDGVVQYPFGYGLSYTTFSQSLSSVSLPNNSNITPTSEIEFRVVVKNTGKAEGKEVVQLYAEPPYTKGGIEKSAANLVGYGKTKLLAPNESEEIVIKVKVSDILSYDAYDKNSNGFKGYELEKGNYKFSIRQNSHVAWEGAQNSATYKVADTVKVENDLITGKPVHNQFDAEHICDGIALDGSNSNQNITYLSRANFSGTFSTKMANNRNMSDAIKNVALYTAAMADADIDNTLPDVAWDSGKSYDICSGNIGTKGNAKPNELGMLLGEDFDAPEWDDVLAVIPANQAKQSVLHGYCQNRSLPSINKPATSEFDGPNQVGSFNTEFGKSNVGYPNSTVLAQTFSQELQYHFGYQMGLDAISSAVDGLYAPGVNLHRTAFCGRNYEYYSEDPILSGKAGAQVIRGMLNNGIYVYLKHFICYEQEICRDGLYTWLTEQNLRENYLVPFRICIEEGGLTGIMTSYNRLGATWAGGHKNLIKEVLETEWGYKGAILTDYSDHQNFMNMDQALRAGGTLWMDGYQSNGNFHFETNSKTFNNALKEAVKRNLYMYLNAAYRKAEYEAHPDDGFIHVSVADATFIPWGRNLITFGGIGFAVIGAGLVALTFILRGKKPEAE